MNILLFLLISATSQPGFACAEAETLSSRPAVTAGQHAALASPAAAGAVGWEYDRDDDLVFYLSLHAQAVSVTAGPATTSWLELRPIVESQKWADLPVDLVAEIPQRAAADGCLELRPDSADMLLQSTGGV